MRHLLRDTEQVPRENWTRSNSRTKGRNAVTFTSEATARVAYDGEMPTQPDLQSLNLPPPTIASNPTTVKGKDPPLGTDHHRQDRKLAGTTTGRNPHPTHQGSAKNRNQNQNTQPLGYSEQPNHLRWALLWQTGTYHPRAKFAQLTAQVIDLKQKGEIILTGDFDTKIEILDMGIIQSNSRNGIFMEEFIQNTSINLILLKPKIGRQTKGNRHNPTDKSVTDYIPSTPNTVRQTKNLSIDEARLVRMKGKHNHNTIMLQITEFMQKDNNKRWIWRINNKESWKK